METIFTVLASGVVTGLVTWGAIKSDLVWLKNTINQHHDRITYLERKET